MVSESLEQNRSIKKILVLGGGSAGFLAAMALKRHLPDSEIVVVRSTKLGVIGVGEGTIFSVVSFLHNFLGLDSRTFLNRTKASLKLGIKFLWGKSPYFSFPFSTQFNASVEDLPLPRGYYSFEDPRFASVAGALIAHDKACTVRGNQPQFTRNFAYHLENRTFVSHLEELADEFGIEKIDEMVVDVEQDDNGIRSIKLSDGRILAADLFIDCSGFQSLLLGKALQEPFQDFDKALFCDRAIVGGWERTDESYHPYTTAETMDAGWCWRIDHDDLINRGYVFSSRFISDGDAEQEYRTKNPKIKSSHLIKYRPGIYRRTWVKNVIAIGNAAGFVEPLEATAIAVICDSLVHVVRALKSSDMQPSDTQRQIYNRVQAANWEIIRDFLATHYRFNERLNTPFWQASRADVELGSAQEIVDLYREVGPDLSLLNAERKRDFFGLDGYLCLLVGQQVPFKRQPKISATEKNRWRVFRQSLDDAARCGMDSSSYLKILRERGFDIRRGQINSPDEAATNRPRPIPRMNDDQGELRWQ